MDRIEIANNSIENLINIIQEQENEIGQYKIQLSKLTKVFKLMSSGNFDVIKLSKDFDSCETENDIESLYQQYITSEEQK